MKRNQRMQSVTWKVQSCRVLWWNRFCKVSSWPTWNRISLHSAMFVKCKVES